MKDEFVRDLGKLLAKYNINGIAKMEYKDTGIDEIVTITYSNNYKKDINVTLDSEAAIIKDIARQGGF